MLVAATDLLVQIDSENSTQPLVLQNADGGPNWGNAFMTVPNKDGYEDGVLQGKEFVDIPFVVCLKSIEPFSLMVNMRGVAYVLQ